MELLQPHPESLIFKAHTTPENLLTPDSNTKDSETPCDTKAEEIPRDQVVTTDELLNYYINIRPRLRRQHRQNMCVTKYGITTRLNKNHKEVINPTISEP